MTLFEAILILLMVTIAISFLFHHIKIPTILGYILVGIFAGPHALALITNTHAVRSLAEYGLLFLMFTIGLEFSLQKIRTMKKAVFAYGGLQVLSTIVIITLAALSLQMTLPQSLVIGCIVAMSSTALVAKQLIDQSEIKSKHGTLAVGVLLFQDLAVIPVLMLIPNLAGIEFYNLTIVILESIVKAVFAIIVIFLLGRVVLKPAFYILSKAKALEIFTLFVLFVALAAAWLTNQLGLSLTLGAFLAGMMLAETDYKHQIELDIRTIRNVLLGVFFISLGMEFEPFIMIEAWPWIFLLFIALVFFKTVLIWLLGVLLKIDLTNSLRTAIILAHGGEFGFAILSLAMVYKILPADYAQVTLGALLLSLIVAPLLIRYNAFLANASSYTIAKKNRAKKSD